MVALHFFIHVPKTAGVTVREWLADAYGRDEILFVYPGQIAEALRGHTCSIEAVYSEPHRLLPSLQVIYGHYHFTKDWFVYRNDARGLGFVREPRARAVSWYRYVMRSVHTLPGPQMTEISAAIRAGRSGIRELYEECGIRDLDNAIVRYYSGADVPCGAIGERHLKQAIENVDRHFDFVGHVDWFEESMRGIARILGRSYEGGVARNVSPGSSSAELLAEFDVDFLDAITRYDRAFVDYIEDRFFS